MGRDGTPERKDDQRQKRLKKRSRNDSWGRDTTRSYRRSKRSHQNRSSTRSSTRSSGNIGESSGRGSLTSRDTDFARLADVLSDVVKAGSVRSSNFLNEKFLPEFDPAAENLTSADWIDKININATIYGWDDKMKLYLAVCKLKGNAKLWYDELHHSRMSWQDFSHAVIEQFSGELQFGKLFHEAANYISSPGQDLQTYCFIKLGKINKLKLGLTEENLVDFVTHGIHDQNIRVTLQTARCKSLTEFNKCLSIFVAENSRVKETKHITKRDVTVENVKKTGRL